MKRSVPDEAARIDRLWDAIVRRRPVDPVDGDRDLVNAMVAIHAGDDAPLPDRGFARCLEDRLMNQWPIQPDG